MTVELPEGFDPRASVQSAKDEAGAFDALLKRHGVSRAGQFKPASPWRPDGKPRGTSTPPTPGTAPTNGGIAGNLR